MDQLQVINYNEKLVTDSREVAEMIEKEHSHLLRDVRNYIEILGKSKIGFADFFIESYYTDSQGKPRPHFYLTKQGCEMVANKMTGQKGVLFTAIYVSKFNDMEKHQVKLQPKSQAELMLMYAEQFVEYEKRINRLEADTAAAHHRIDNFDKIDVLGNLQQRLNKMIRLYAANSGLTFQQAWRNFKQSYNTAYRTNITMLVENYKLKHGLKNLSTPEYLARTNRLDDAVRVADKLLNRAS